MQHFDNEITIHTSARGPRGIPGERGKRGHGGMLGPQGHSSQLGAQGFQGHVFASGKDGPQGLIGQQGSPLHMTFGERGFLGQQGPQSLYLGPQGFDGINTSGFQGYQGLQGLIGFQGDVEQGITGPQGFRGKQGAQGVNGYQGRNGSQGPVGYDGNEGVQGPIGAQGDMNQTLGPTGIQGFSGAQGPNSVIRGAFGPQGFSGKTSTETRTGFAGSVISGPQGLRGPQGARGSQGYEGFPGTNSPFIVRTSVSYESAIWFINNPTILDLPFVRTYVVANGKCWAYFSGSFKLPEVPLFTVVKIELIYYEESNPANLSILDQTFIETATPDFSYDVFLTGFISNAVYNRRVALRATSQTTAIYLSPVLSQELTLVILPNA